MESNSIEQLKYPISNFSKPKDISPKDIENWIETIETFPQKIKNIAFGLSLEELNYKYRPDGWTIKQVVHHCADSHMNSFIRFKLALTEDNPTIKPYDEAKWSTLIDANSNTIIASLQIIDGLHARWVLLLKSLDENHFKRTFFHPESQTNNLLETILAFYAWHCKHHLAHIEQAILYKEKFN